MNAPGQPSKLHAARLAGTLLTSGLLDERWAEAFAATPRDLFLPAFYQPGHDGWELITAATAGQQRWLSLAYHDVTWVQHFNGPRHHSETPACSCLQPSLAAQLLTMLPARPQARICEIGPGTGWLTGILTYRYGSDYVVGIELDPDLVDQARSTLAALGRHPRLLCADGFHGHRETAPYDAILSTAATTRIPQPWLDQTRQGGRIITPLRGAIAVIDVVDTGKATGRFLPGPVQILPLRTPHAAGPHVPPDRTSPDCPADSTAAITLRDPRFRFFLGLLHPHLTVHDHGLLSTLTVTDPTGSQIQVNALGKTDIEGGSLVWDLLCDAHSEWKLAKRPGPSDITLELSQGRQWACASTSPTAQRWLLR
jgi:protein-L-isoaspartate O-methyltransferase